MPNDEKISVTVSPEMLQVIRESVTAGENGSTSEAVRNSVRVWRCQRLDDAERLNPMRVRIRRSLDDPRPDMSLDEVDARLDASFAQAEQLQQ